MEKRNIRLYSLFIGAVVFICVQTSFVYAEPKEQESSFEQRLAMWKRLRPEERAQVRAKYENYEKLSPEEKSKMKQRWHSWQEKTPEEKRRIMEWRRKWRKSSPEEKERMRKRYKRWRGLPKEKRQKIRERIRNMTPEERRAFRRHARQKWREKRDDQSSDMQSEQDNGQLHHRSPERGENADEGLGRVCDKRGGLINRHDIFSRRRENDSRKDMRRQRMSERNGNNRRQR